MSLMCRASEFGFSNMRLKLHRNSGGSDLHQKPFGGIRPLATQLSGIECRSISLLSDENKTKVLHKCDLVPCALVDSRQISF